MHPNQDSVGLIRRATQRAATIGAALASVVLLATCDLDKILNVDTTKAISLDSTELKLLFTGSSTVAGVATFRLGGTATVGVVGVNASLDLSQVPKEYTSADTTIISVVKSTGVMTVKAVGTVKITARILAPELGAGVTRSENVRARFKDIKITAPTATDSIQGLGVAQNRTATVFGLKSDNTNAVAVTLDSLRSRDTTVFRVSGTTISARKNGTAQLVAFFDGLIDSVPVRVRQVAKSITFQTTDYTARHVNFDLSVPPLTAKDVTDSLIPTPTLTWRTKDTTKATVVKATGVVRVKSTAGDSLWAKMDTVERAQKIVVAQVAGSLTKFQGDARSDTVGKNVKVVPTVQVLDSGLTPIVGALVLFKIGVGLNASVGDTLPVLTDANGRAKPTSWKLGDVAGTSSNTLIATSGSATTTFTVTALAGPAQKLGFVVQPTSATKNVAITPAIAVQIQDSLGNVIAGATNVVTLALSNNPAAAALAGTLTATAVNGVATFSGNISINNAASGYTLQATSGTLVAAISNGFDVYGSATKVGFTTQPGGTTAGSTMSAVRVAVQDSLGTTVANSVASVTIAFSTNPGAATLGGTLTVTAVAGVATFSNLSVSAAGSGYALQATAAGVPTGAVSNAFTISAVGTPSKLAFSVQPSNVASTGVITPAMKVQVLDVNGGLVTSSSQQITLSIESTSPAGGTVGGTTSRSAVAGVATFDDITVSKAGTGFKLLATASGTTLSTATSASFTVTTGTATKLGFFQAPTHTVFGATMTPGVVAEVQDANGNRVTAGSTFSVSLTLTSCGTATLTGGGAQTTSSGLATFNGLSISAAANNCTLTASATGLTGVGASLNSVASTGAVRLSFTTEPSSSTTAGVALTRAPVVAFQDASGNNATAISSVQIVLTVLSGPQTFFSGGVDRVNTTTTASFSSLAFQVAGSYSLIANASGFRPDTSALITVNPAAADRVGIITPSANVVAGVPFSPTVKAAVQDQFSNTIAGTVNQIFIFACDQVQCDFQFTGSTKATASDGVATFPGLAIRTAGAGVSICASAAGLNATCSGTRFDVAAAPLSKLAFVVQPPSSSTAGTVISPAMKVAGQDSVGNVIADFSSAITMALTGGTAGAVLGGTKTVAPAAGSSSFSTLSVDKPGTGYKLSASSSGVSTATSSTFNIDPGPAAKLAWITQPASTTFLGAPLAAAGTTAARVAIQDALGNTVTSDNRQVTITATAGPSSTFKAFGSNVTTANFSASSGIVSLPSSDLQMTTVGTGYTLRAALTGLTSATSTAFNVGAFDVKTKVNWTTQPTGTSYGVRFGASPIVSIVDAYGNVVTSATDAITVAIGTDANPTTTLSGGSATAATSGVLTLNNARLDRAGTNYTLVASGTGLTSATSTAFGVTSPGQVTDCCVGYHWVFLGSTIYFTGSSSVKSVSVTGGPVTTITGSTNASQITTDGTNIFWAERGSTNNGDAFIKKYTVSTSTVSTLTVGLVSLTNSDATKIYSDGINVYFTSYNPATGSAIRSISVNAISGTPVDLFGNSTAFFVSGGLIYFRDPGANTIRRMNTSGGSLTTLSTSPTTAEMFALDGTTLYFNDGVSIKSIANATTTALAVTPTTVLTSPGTVYAVAASAGNLYFNFNGSLRRYSPTNFATFTELSSVINAYYFSVLLDSIDVYFYYNNCGCIAKVPK